MPLDLIGFRSASWKFHFDNQTRFGVIPDFSWHWLGEEMENSMTRIKLISE